MSELRIEATVGNLEKVLSYVDAKLEECGCPMQIQIQIDIAVEEIFVNIANYAYTPGKGDAVMHAEIVDGKVFRMVFKDKGIPYNPLAKEDPDITLSAEERQIGGLGIFMVKKSMDDMQYERMGDQNVLTISKNIA